MHCAHLITALALYSSVATNPVVDHRKEDQINDTCVLGGPHGTDFSDLRFVSAQAQHRRISKVTIGPCEHLTPLTYIKFEFTDWLKSAMPDIVSEHGKIRRGQQVSLLELKENGHIIRLAVRTAKVHVGIRWKTRVSGIELATDGDRSIGCGVDGNKAHEEWDARDDRAFLYFSGAAGHAIDNLQGHTIPIADYDA